MADRDLVNVLTLVDRIGPALERRDRETLCDIIAKLVALRAPMGEQWEQLAYLSTEIGEFGLARKAADLFAEASGGGDAGTYRKAALLFDFGFVGEADALLRSIPDNLPDPISNAYSRAVAALNLGDAQDARHCLERVVTSRPQMGSAWLLLAQSANLVAEPALADQIVAAGAAMAGAPANERALHRYALGRVHADRGEHEPAFEAFAQGARLMKSMLAYDARQDRAEAATALDGYGAEQIAALAGAQSEPTGRAIFVIGLPRSGTTLVEQILTAHGDVGDGGEVNTLSLLSNEVGGPSLDAVARYVQAQGAAPAARLWDHWLAERFPAPGRIVNKAVDTSRALGVAASLLPEAPLIWITRDALDRAWSCFRTSFLGGVQPWSYDWEDMAEHFRIEEELLARWQDILGDRLLVVPYETLVTDPAAEIRRILAHCGLAEQPQVFAPHENRRPAPTASMVQVRRPIHREGIGAAEPYRAFLAPFIAAYRARGGQTG